MSNNNLKIGVGAGILAGAGAGLKVAKGKIANFTEAAYVDSRIKANLNNVVDTFTGQKRTAAFKRIAQKAQEDFPVVLQKYAKNTKIKWAAGLAAVGALAGIVISKIANKSDK